MLNSYAVLLNSLCFERSITMVLKGVTAIWFLGMSVQDQEKGVCAWGKKKHPVLSAGFMFWMASH